VGVGVGVGQAGWQGGGGGGGASGWLQRPVRGVHTLRYLCLQQLPVLKSATCLPTTGHSCMTAAVMWMAWLPVDGMAPRDAAPFAISVLDLFLLLALCRVSGISK
jgi:hypothetical protein